MLLRRSPPLESAAPTPDHPTAAGSAGEQLWEHSPVSRLLALIDTPEALEASRLAAARGWLS